MILGLPRRSVLSTAARIMCRIGKSRAKFEEIQEQLSSWEVATSNTSYFPKDNLPDDMWAFTDILGVKAVAG